MGRRPGSRMARRLGPTARLGPQTVVGLPPKALVGLAAAALGVGLSSTPVVGLEAALVVAAALGLGLVAHEVAGSMSGRGRSPPACDRFLRFKAP
jgi:hypothetical protein